MKKPKAPPKKKVAIIMGSKTDLKVMQAAADVLKEFGIPYHLEVVSAHRTPEKMFEFARLAHERFSLIIAGAGGAAHLPGMVACLTTLPVIGVPVQLGSLKGMDALLSVVQMPKGIPVATVAIDNAANAGLLAARFVGMNDEKIQKKLQKYQSSQKKKVAQMNREIRLAR
ncbi:MAG: 5-(carboxyamino)imidazole ribonucleotide mutase [Bdellovibrio sp.]|jgi:phosphoribosylaminoimidazole carboxylase PurE protein